MIFRIQLYYQAYNSRPISTFSLLPHFFIQEMHPRQCNVSNGPIADAHYMFILKTIKLLWHVNQAVISWTQQPHINGNREITKEKVNSNLQQSTVGWPTTPFRKFYWALKVIALEITNEDGAIGKCDTVEVMVEN